MWIDADFEVPELLEASEFRLRMLQASDAEADYEAVMESQERLRAGSPNGWPRPGFTLEENRADLVRHEAEFLARDAFAYTMVTSKDDQVLGCLYINPSEEADADVYMWVRESRREELIGPAALILTPVGEPDRTPDSGGEPGGSGDQGIRKLEEVERDLVVRAMRATGDNQTRAAQLLGVTRDQLRYRVKKFGL